VAADFTGVEVEVASAFWETVELAAGTVTAAVEGASIGVATELGMLLADDGAAVGITVNVLAAAGLEGAGLWFWPGLLVGLWVGRPVGRPEKVRDGKVLFWYPGNPLGKPELGLLGKAALVRVEEEATDDVAEAELLAGAEVTALVAAALVAAALVAGLAAEVAAPVAAPEYRAGPGTV